MFAKAAFFLFALATFVNSAPIDITVNPGVRPLHPIKVTLPGGGYRLQPVALKRDLSWDVSVSTQGQQAGAGGGAQGQGQDDVGNYSQGQGQGQGQGLDFDLESLTLALSKREDFPYQLIGANARLPWISRKREDFPYGLIGANARLPWTSRKREDFPSGLIGAGSHLPFPFPKRDLWSDFIDGLKSIGLNVNKRDTVDLDTLGSQILGGLRSNGLDEYVEHFSTRIQRLKDLLSGDVSQTQITAEAKNLLLEYRQVLAGRHVNKPVEARDVVIDAQVLAQLQNFVVSTANLLRVLRGSDAVNAFLSKINELKVEAQNGTLDANDLLSAARDIVSSIL